MLDPCMTVPFGIHFEFLSQVDIMDFI